MSVPNHASTQSHVRHAACTGAVALILLSSCVTFVRWEQPAAARQNDGIGSAVLWSAVASSGVPDDQDINGKEVIFTGPTASIRSTLVNPTSVTLRYMMGTTPLTTGDLTLRVRYFDRGPLARVRVQLKQYDVLNGSTANVLRFDSDDFPTSPSFQVREVSDCGISTDFESFVYYIEATLDKTEGSGDPQLVSIQLIDSPCP